MARSSEAVEWDRMLDIDDLGMEPILNLPVPALADKVWQYGSVPSWQIGDGRQKDGVRDFTFGDDYRRIDARASARYGSLQVRERVASVPPRLWAVTDMALSRYAEPVLPRGVKRDLARSALVMVLNSALAHDMPIGLVAVNEETDVLRLPGLGLEYTETSLMELEDISSPSHIEKAAKNPALKRRWLARRQTPEILPETQNFADALSFAGEVAARNVIVLVSDFRSRDWEPELATLEEQDNAVVAIEITNPLHYSLEDGVGRYDTEYGTFVAGSNKDLAEKQATYAQRALWKQLEINRMLRDHGVGHVQLTTEDPAWMGSLAEQMDVLVGHDD